MSGFFRKLAAWRWHWILPAIGLIAAGCWHFFVLAQGEQSDLLWSQMAAFPLLLWLFATIRPTECRVPALVLAIALVGGGVGAAYAYTYRRGTNGTFLLARLAGDELEADTRIFRERLNAAIARTSSRVRVGRYYAPLNGAREGWEMLHQDHAIRAIIRGNKGWLEVSLARLMPLRLSTAPLNPVLRKFFPLDLVRSVGGFGMGFEPSEATAEFLADVFAALPALTTADVVPGHEFEQFAEQRLYAAANVGGPWTTAHHRALPWWLLGNAYLMRSLSGASFEPAELECALFAYARARLYLTKYTDNPALFLAIRNNEAIALAVKGTLEDSSPDLALALVKLNVAHDLVERTGLTKLSFGVNRALRRNWEWLSGERQ